MHAPLCIVLFTVFRGEQDLVAVLLEITHDAAVGDFLHERSLELLFRRRLLFRSPTSSTPGDRQRAQHNNQPPISHVASYFDDVLAAAAFLSSARAPLRIPNMP